MRRHFYKPNTPPVFGGNGPQGRFSGYNPLSLHTRSLAGYTIDMHEPSFWKRHPFSAIALRSKPQPAAPGESQRDAAGGPSPLVRDHVANIIASYVRRSRGPLVQSRRQQGWMASLGAVGAVRHCCIHHWRNYSCRNGRQKAMDFGPVLALIGGLPSPDQSARG